MSTIALFFATALFAEESITIVEMSDIADTVPATIITQDTSVSAREDTIPVSGTIEQKMLHPVSPLSTEPVEPSESVEEDLRWLIAVYPLSSFAFDGVKLDIRYTAGFRQSAFLTTFYMGDKYFNQNYNSYGFGGGYWYALSEKSSWYTRLALAGFMYKNSELLEASSVYGQPKLVERWDYALYPEIVFGYFHQWDNHFTLETGIDLYGLYALTEEDTVTDVFNLITNNILSLGIGYQF